MSMNQTSEILSSEEIGARRVARLAMLERSKSEASPLPSEPLRRTASAPERGTPSASSLHQRQTSNASASVSKTSSTPASKALPNASNQPRAAAAAVKQLPQQLPSPKPAASPPSSSSGTSQPSPSSPQRALPKNTPKSSSSSPPPQPSPSPRGDQSARLPAEEQPTPVVVSGEAFGRPTGAKSQAAVAEASKTSNMSKPSKTGAKSFKQCLCEEVTGVVGARFDMVVDTSESSRVVVEDGGIRLFSRDDSDDDVCLNAFAAHVNGVVACATHAVTTRDGVSDMHYSLSCFERCLRATTKAKREGLARVFSLLRESIIDGIIQLLEPIPGIDTDPEIMQDFMDLLLKMAPVRELLSGLSENARAHSISNLLFHQFVASCATFQNDQMEHSGFLDQHESVLEGYVALSASPLFCERLSVSLMQQTSTSASGRLLEEHCCLAPLLHHSSLPLTSSTKLIFSASSPSDISPPSRTIFAVQDTLQAHQLCCTNVFLKILKMPDNIGRTHWFRWASTVVRLNAFRAQEPANAVFFHAKEIVTEYPPSVTLEYVEVEQVRHCSSDGFLVNLSAAVLRLCLPFLANTETKQPHKLSSIDLRCLSDSRFGPLLENTVSLSGNPFVLPETLTDTRYSFTTECWLVAARLLSVGLCASVRRFRALFAHLIRVTDALVRAERMSALQARKEESEVWEGWVAHLLDPSGVGLHATRFYVDLLHFLAQKIREGDVEGVAALPVSFVQDAIDWMAFVSTHSEVEGRVSSRAFLLSPADAVTVAASLCVILHARLPPASPSTPAVELVRRVELRTAVMTALHALVLQSPAPISQAIASDTDVCAVFGAELLSLYVAVDKVEGYDINKSDFDKFGARCNIGQLLHALVEEPSFFQSLVRTSRVQTSLFEEFVVAMWANTGVMLDFGLRRLQNIRQVEVLQSNAEEWGRLEESVKAEKLGHLSMMYMRVRGALQVVSASLNLLESWSSRPQLVEAMTRRGPTATSAASAVVHVLEMLCGPRGTDLKVSSAAECGWDPRRLLCGFVTLLVAMAQHSEFVSAYAHHQDYSPAVLQKVIAVLSREQMTSSATVTAVSDFLVATAAQSTPIPEHTLGEDEDFGPLCSEEEYVSQFSSLVFDCAALTDSAATPKHAFKEVFVKAATPLPAKMKAVMKEWRSLPSLLPVHRNSSIFVRHDDNRTDVVRALVVGPVDTPYAYGCFFFDVYLPTEYPTVPPMIKFINGAGTTSFNPNLYSDGKVCLSLLGFQYSGEASEKWEPGKSTLAQVLLSIQGLIFVEQPFLNDVDFVGMQRTTSDEARSEDYNSAIRVLTLRHAMTDVLRSPPAGFEDIIQRHFSIMKSHLLHQCRRWQDLCAPSHRPKFERAVADFRRALDQKTNQQ